MKVKMRWTIQLARLMEVVLMLLIVVKKLLMMILMILRLRCAKGLMHVLVGMLMLVK